METAWEGEILYGRMKEVSRGRKRREAERVERSFGTNKQGWSSAAKGANLK